MPDVWRERVEVSSRETRKRDGPAAKSKKLGRASNSAMGLESRWASKATEWWGLPDAPVHEAISGWKQSIHHLPLSQVINLLLRHEATLTDSIQQRVSTTAGARRVRARTYYDRLQSNKNSGGDILSEVAPPRAPRLNGIDADWEALGIAGSSTGHAGKGSNSYGVMRPVQTAPLPTHRRCVHQ